MKQNENHNLRH